MRRAVISLVTGFCLASGPMPAMAQDQTLADIRQELSVLYVEVQQLKRELSTTGGVSVSVGGDTLQRVDLIERELRRLTSKTEELEFRIGRVVSDGTNRIGDLEFRLCELEADCDIAALSQGTTLGGGEAATPVPVTPPSDDTQLAVGEQADFDRAREALDAGSFRSAAELFATFAETYTGGPLSAEAHYLRGEALAAAGDTSEAARAYLTSFSGNPKGPRAADALLKLGTSLAVLGQTSEACVTLGEVGARFPGSVAESEALVELSRLNCG